MNFGQGLDLQLSDYHRSTRSLVIFDLTIIKDILLMLSTIVLK
jgi:hypothetical protein